MTRARTNDKTAITKVEEYAIVKQYERAAEILKTNIGAGGLDITDLTHISIPSGGALAWTIKTLEGEQQVSEFEGIPLAFKDERLYWAKSFAESGGGDPPDCRTTNSDCSVGVGNPGGPCDTCEMNQWTETPTGRKPCSEHRALFVCGATDLIPFVLRLPITSLKECRRFFILLGQNGLKYYEAILSFGLKSDTNKQGIKYSVIDLKVKQRLTAEQAEHMAIVNAALQKQIGGFTLADEIRKEQDQDNVPY